MKISFCDLHGYSAGRIQGELQKHRHKYAGEVIGICMAVFLYCLHMSKMSDALVRQAHVCKTNA